MSDMNDGELEHDIVIGPVTDDDEGSEFKRDEVVRIEHDLGVSWSGVRGCCSGDRPQREVNSAFTRWRNDQIAAHVNQQYLGSGHSGGTARCSQSGGGGWGGSGRSCRGGVTIKAWAEFLKT